MKKQIHTIILTMLATAVIASGATYFLLWPIRQTINVAQAPAVAPETADEQAPAAEQPEEKVYPEIGANHAYYNDYLETNIFIDGNQYATAEPLKCSNLHSLLIQYGDLTGDGKEEAVVGIPSGGTAGDLAVLVYTIENKLPKLIGKIEGYKISAKITERGELLTSQPYYLETDANCCPSFFDRTTYKWDGSEFKPISTERVGAENLK